MNTKLTLSIDKQVIELSKEYAAAQNRSLSDLIEAYLKALTKERKPGKAPAKKIKNLRGSFKAPADFDYKTVLEQEINRKHG